MITATLHHTEDVTPRLKTFWFEVPQPFKFTPGEYVEMYVEHDPDSRGEHRKFTISSIPSDPYVGFTIALPKYSSSFKQALLKLHHGDTVRISEPMGDFVLPKMIEIPVIGIAAGSGITPFMSIARDPSQQRRNLSITHIVRAEQDVVQVPSRKFNYYLLPEQAPSIFDIHTANIPSSETLFYLAGPEKIIETFRDELIAKGVAAQRVVTDLFIGAATL